jgi:hypothetical protein
MRAFLAGAQRAGYDVVPNSLTADVAVIWSVLWFGRMRDNQKVYEHYRKQGKPVIVIDIGALNRGVTWKVAVNHVTAAGYYGHQENLDPDRPRRFGLQLKSPASARPEILICSQHAHSLQMTGWTTAEAWVNEQVKKLRQYTDRPFIVRPHPRSQLNPGLLESKLTIQTPKKLINTYDSFDFDLSYHAVVNHNSGPGIQAAIAGTRPLVDNSSLAFPVSFGMAALEQSYTVDREQWLIEISHTEYSVTELEQAIWYPRLKPALT